MPTRAGRPKHKLPNAIYVLTRRVRQLVDKAHDGNLSEASRATGIPHPTLRDLYVGRTVNPNLKTMDMLQAPYGIDLSWFTDENRPDDVPLVPRVVRLPPAPWKRGRERDLREVTIPFEAWPMYALMSRLEQRLQAEPATPKRPIVGEALGGAFKFRLTMFLFQPLLAAEKSGAARPIAPGTKQWVRMLRGLGEMWLETLDLGR